MHRMLCRMPVVCGKMNVRVRNSVKERNGLWLMEDTFNV
jgi:hypothetical protein